MSNKVKSSIFPLGVLYKKFSCIFIILGEERAGEERGTLIYIYRIRLVFFCQIIVCSGWAIVCFLKQSVHAFLQNYFFRQADEWKIKRRIL